MALNKAEGITLFSSSLKEKSRIIRVYTLERGLLSFVTNYISRKNSAMISFCSPCTYSEIIYMDKDRDLLNVKEITIKNLYLPLRDSFEKLEAAICIAKSTLTSQQENKPNSTLFNLIERFLTKISNAQNPLAYACSFQLKLLILEGLFDLSFKCSICNSSAKIISRGECFCSKHSYDGITFEEGELKKLFQLSTAKKFSDIDKAQVEKSLKQKIQGLFLQIFN